MPLVFENGVAYVMRLGVPLTQFPELLQRHKDADSETSAVEKLAKIYVANGFRSADTRALVKRVCKWGRYSGVGGKALKYNRVGRIARKLQLSHQALMRGDYVSAITEATKINGFAVSFGSKHLRMMAPGRAVVLDSIISENLGYKRTPTGYAEFIADCENIRDMLNQQGICPTPNRTSWRISEVEMAIFMSLQD